MKAVKLSLIAGLSAITLAACNSGTDTADTTTADDNTEVVQAEPMAPDAGMSAGGDQNIVQMAQANPDVSTLVSAITAADLGTTLSGAGPFTVFAPTNAAFNKIDKAKRDSWMEPTNKTALGSVLKYHVVAGNVKAADLAKQIKDGGGKAKINTLDGSLTASMEGSNVVLTDATGAKATVTSTDMMASKWHRPHHQLGADAEEDVSENTISHTP